MLFATILKWCIKVNRFLWPKNSYFCLYEFKCNCPVKIFLKSQSVFQRQGERKEGWDKWDKGTVPELASSNGRANPLKISAEGQPHHPTTHKYKYSVHFLPTRRLS